MTTENAPRRLAFLIGLSQERLKEVFYYDPINGVFIDINTNKEVGSLNPNGYYYVKINGYYFKRHQLAWLYTYGYLPEHIDHVNRFASDDSIANLREATYSQQMANRSVFINNYLSVKGVRERNGRYQARIRHNDICITIGTFDTLEKAKAAYNAKGKELFGDFFCE